MSASSAAPLATGERVGNYRVMRRLAIGGMAIVYEAAHIILPRRVALKVMNRELLASAGAYQRLLQEACILESFAHPGVVRIYDCGMLPDHRPWIAMELVDGTPLSSRLARGGLFSIDQLIELLDAVAEVLVAAHARGIVHRDLKPDNILLEGHDLRPLRLIDWGVAVQDLPGPRITLNNATVGTPTYMAPEQARGMAVDGRCDVYALGIVAHEALTGRPPFVGGNAIEVMMQHLTSEPPPLRASRPDVPVYLAAMIDQMLEKDPERRLTAAELRTALASFAGIDPYDELSVDEPSDGGPADELGPIGGVALGSSRWTPQPLVATGPAQTTGERQAVPEEVHNGS